MAGTIAYNIGAQLVNGTLTDNFRSGQVNEVQNLALREIIVITAAITTGTQPTFSFITTNGVLLIRSLEPAGGNYVDWGPYISGAQKDLGRIQPGTVEKVRIKPGTALSFTAHTAPWIKREDQ